jgi:hypothetical protein
MYWQAMGMRWMTSKAYSYMMSAMQCMAGKWQYFSHTVCPVRVAEHKHDNRSCYVMNLRLDVYTTSKPATNSGDKQRMLTQTMVAVLITSTKQPQRMLARCPEWRQPLLPVLSATAL